METRDSGAATVRIVLQVTVRPEVVEVSQNNGVVAVPGVVTTLAPALSAPAVARPARPRRQAVTVVGTAPPTPAPVPVVTPPRKRGRPKRVAVQVGTAEVQPVAQGSRTKNQWANPETRQKMVEGMRRARAEKRAAAAAAAAAAATATLESVSAE